MSKILKRLTTIALAAVMLLGTMTTAFAAENNGTNVGNENTGSITIHKYKMPDAENAFESNTNKGGIAITELPPEAKPLDGVQFSIVKMEQNEAGEWEESVAEADTHYVTTQNGGVASVTGIPLGRYKVEEIGFENSDGSDTLLPNTGDEAVTGKAFFVDVPMTEDDGQKLNYNIHVYPKNEVLSIDKDVTFLGNKHDSFNMGEEQTWIIKTTIPGNIALKNKENPTEYVYAKKYEIVDELDTQLTYKGNLSVAVTTKDDVMLRNLEVGDDYTFTVPSEGEKGGTLTVNLTATGMDRLKRLINAEEESKQAAFLQIRFDTVINETANLGTAIENNATLNFTNTVGVDAEQVSVPEDERPEVHTGGVKIKKIAGDKEESENNVLQDVEFMIFDSSEKAKAAVKKLQDNKASEIENALEVYDPYQEKFTNIVKSDEEGIAEFQGLAYYTNKADEAKNQKGDDADTGAKTYYIVETKTAPGYQLPSKYFEVTVNKDSSKGTADVDTIVNVRPSKLPAAGGKGTIIFTVVGLGIMAAAGIIVLKSRKKKEQ